MLAGDNLYWAIILFGVATFIGSYKLYIEEIEEYKETIERYSAHVQELSEKLNKSRIELIELRRRCAQEIAKRKRLERKQSTQFQPPPSERGRLPE